jgi:hypothetical protein
VPIESCFGPALSCPTGPLLVNARVGSRHEPRSASTLVALQSGPSAFGQVRSFRFAPVCDIHRTPAGSGKPTFVQVADLPETTSPARVIDRVPEGEREVMGGDHRECDAPWPPCRTNLPRSGRAKLTTQYLDRADLRRPTRVGTGPNGRVRFPHRWPESRQTVPANSGPWLFITSRAEPPVHTDWAWTARPRRQPASCISAMRTVDANLPTQSD